MLANLLQKLHQAVNAQEEHDVSEGKTLNCARCGSEIQSLVDAVHIEVDDNILFFCSETCNQRYMKTRLNQQIRLAVNMVKSMKEKERTEAIATI